VYTYDGNGNNTGNTYMGTTRSMTWDSTSAGDQTLLQHERYFPFGELDTGVHYFGARYYDPKTRVWQSPDPILGKYMSGNPNSGPTSGQFPMRLAI
jgi:RHS repeat-associated protein